MTAPERPVYVDANILIYAMETDSEEGLLSRRWLMQIDRGRFQAVTSELSVLEVLPHPIAAGNRALVAGYRRLLSGKTRLPVMSISSGILLRAAELRAELALGAPDAIHVATALIEHCSSFLTNDTRLKLPLLLPRLDLKDAMSFHP